MASIPSDLIRSILSRFLNVLLRFSCVSKSFKPLIENSGLINLYRIYEYHRFGIPQSDFPFGYSEILLVDLNNKTLSDTVLECLKLKCMVELSVLNGCLTVTSNYQRNVCVWVMKRYAVKESWTKLLSCPVSEIGSSLGCHMVTLAYSRSRGKVLFNGDGVLSWYDLVSGKFEPCSNRYSVRGRPRLKTFIGSLVSLEK